jgi:hypothetical protein
MANENFDKVYEYMRENNIWDDIYMNVAEDHDGRTYVIFDSNSDVDKFDHLVKEVLEIEDGEIFFVEDVLDIDVVYSDEYTTCDDCSHVIRTSPDSYHWQPDYYVGDGFIVCGDCFKNNEDYQEGYINEKINDPKTAINGLITESQLESLGFQKIGEEYENGWYHVEDNPQEIYERLSDKYEEIVFLVNNVEQFRINFVTFVRGEINEEE